ncbi:hypothetical protein BJV78DRAFT_1155827 [Lactifluus subvellereus]|nr:hypothetical protein BJV78DRAFT_1155827 [Lactifluus subvellereus]
MANTQRQSRQVTDQVPVLHGVEFEVDGSIKSSVCMRSLRRPVDNGHRIKSSSTGFLYLVHRGLIKPLDPYPTMSRPALPTDLSALPQIATSNILNSLSGIASPARKLTTVSPRSVLMSLRSPVLSTPSMLIISPKAEIAGPFFDNLVDVAAGTSTSVDQATTLQRSTLSTIRPSVTTSTLEGRLDGFLRRRNLIFEGVEDLHTAGIVYCGLKSMVTSYSLTLGILRSLRAIQHNVKRLEPHLRRARRTISGALRRSWVVRLAHSVA